MSFLGQELPDRDYGGDPMIYMTPLQAAAYIRELGLPCQPSTLAKLRVIGGGPLFLKFGARVRYRREDLDAWIKARLGEPVKNTSAITLTDGEELH
jgi:hypothetical protein